MVYIYESHMGGLYVSDELYDDDKLQCEYCGDFDVLVLSTNDICKVSEYLRKEVNLFGSGGYDVCYVTAIYDQCAEILGEAD